MTQASRIADTHALIERLRTHFNDCPELLAAHRLAPLCVCYGPNREG